MTAGYARWWFQFWEDKTGSGWPGEEEGLVDLDRLYRDQAQVLQWLIDGRRVRSVLELGCADGRLYDALALPGISYCGVDFRSSQIDAFRQRHPELQLFAADAAAFRVEQRFDLIFSMFLLMHFNAAMTRQHLANAHAMLADDGILIIADFRWRSQKIIDLLYMTLGLVRTGSLAALRKRVRAIAMSMHATAYSRGQIIEMGRQAGFSTEFFGSYLLPGYLTARLTKIPA